MKSIKEMNGFLIKEKQALQVMQENLNINNLTEFKN